MSKPNTMEAEPKTAPMTIFYGGKVFVFDSFPADKAGDLMLFAGSETNPVPAPNPNPAPGTENQIKNPMQGRSRGSARRGRGRGSNPYTTEFPPLFGHSSNPGESSSKSAKDVLLTPETAYIQNTIREETVLYIDSSDVQWMVDSWEIKRRYLATQNAPPRFDQYRYVYEQILTELASVQFQHHLADPNRTASPINYSKATIQNIVPIQAWGMHPHVTRTLDIRSKESRYSYWDYIDAFSQAFYYMNPPRSHSWFFRVLPDVLKNDLPNWFLIWWDKFGIQLDAFPEHIRTAFNKWQVAFSHLPVNKEISMTKCMNKIPRLQRVFLYKWWVKMDDPKPKQELLQKIKEHTQACWDASPKSIPAPPVNPFVQIQQELREKYPDLSETELVIKSMDYMKQQFLQSMFSTDSSMKSTSSTQSEDDRATADPYDEDNNFTVLAGESQDPEDDPTGPNYGDIWDSVTEMIADKLLHDKSKGKSKAS
ncbi:unnamed protein product [Camellia sinensis]